MAATQNAKDMFNDNNNNNKFLHQIIRWNSDIVIGVSFMTGIVSSRPITKE